MPLSVGTRLGPYEIVAAIGAGGMGEVYKARDTRLDRTVAIKVLPQHLAADAEARQRFEREARAVSSLNHPNICVLHDIGHQDGIDFLVMECLEGETLAARLTKGPLPLAQALEYAIQVAGALAAAHRRGISHRDLKPANIMLAKSGAQTITKLLDFGLAKWRAPGAGPGGAAASVLPTMSEGLTEKGTILGTLQYMAPEQLEGKEADARSDIFAFGAVLYEMVTGRKAFEGKSHASLIAAILEHDPPPISTLQPLTPPALDRVVKKCVAKDPEERWQTAQDLASELKWLAEGGSGTATAQGGDEARGRLGGQRVAWPVAGVLLLALLALSIAHLRETPPRQQTMRFQLPEPEKETVQELALSPDGGRLAFTTGVAGAYAGRRLWIRPLDSLASQLLPGTEEAFGVPFWSPDSRSIAFFAGDKLKKIDLFGGPPQSLCDAPNGWGGAFGSWAGPVYRASAAGGEARPATALDASRQETRHAGVQFLPDGRHFLYTALSSVAENGAVYAASLDSKETKRLLSNSLNTGYTRDASGQGYLLFTRAETLLAQHFDAARLELQGEPFPIAENLSFVTNTGTPTGIRASGRFSASDTGVLAYQRGSGTAIKELVWFDRDGKRLSTVGEPADYSNPSLSPDEKRLAISRADPQLTKRDIWIFDLARGASSRFTFDRADDSTPIWSPDGKRIAFFSERKGRRIPYIKDATGTGEEQALLEPGEAGVPQDWSPDGRYLLFSSSALPLEGDRKPVPLRYEVGGTPQVSPDGRWLAYFSNESGRLEVYVQSFPGLLAGRSAGKWQVSTAGGNYPQWRRDGQELFYLAPDNKLMAVSVKTGGTAFEAGTPKPLFRVRVEAAVRRTHFLPAANGQRFLVVQVQEQAASSPIDVVLNWAAGIKP